MAIAGVSSVLVLCALVAAAVVFARSRRDPQALVVATGAGVAGFVAFDKVFSAQYVDWLVPLVPAAGAAASAILLGALALTRIGFDRFHAPGGPSRRAVQGRAHLVGVRA